MSSGGAPAPRQRRGGASAVQWLRRFLSAIESAYPSSLRRSRRSPWRSERPDSAVWLRSWQRVRFRHHGNMRSRPRIQPDCCGAFRHSQPRFDIKRASPSRSIGRMRGETKGDEQRCSLFPFRATSIADHIGKRVTRRRARDTEEPAVRLIQIRDYADRDRDRQRAQGDDNS